MVATGVGYAMFLWLVGPVLTQLNMIPSYPTFNPVDMFYGFVVGIFAGAVGVAAQRFVLKAVAWGKALKMSPILRGGILGLALGIIGWIAPLVMFSGDKELPQVVSQAAQFGILVLLGLTLAKVVSLGLSFAGGYQGGNIFPSFFIGGTLGLAINLMFPFIPVPVAMIACMTGIMFAMIPMPLFTMFVLVVVSTAKLLPVMALALAGAGLVILAANQIAPITARAETAST
jgi:H+/Cl- antiporter ClcA